jgi:hypothetical protein
VKKVNHRDNLNRGVVRTQHLAYLLCGADWSPLCRAAAATAHLPGSHLQFSPAGHAAKASQQLVQVLLHPSPHLLPLLVVVYNNSSLDPTSPPQNDTGC